MSIATMAPSAGSDEEQYLVLPRITWDRYLTISEAVGESSSVRTRYRDGRLSFLTKSRLHDWTRHRLADLVKALANASGMLWEDAGEATLRRADLQVGIEPDEAFYLGETAERMLGGRDIDLATQPPPELAIEVEVSRSAEESMPIYAALGVAEVWRLDARRGELRFWRLEADGSYSARERSRFFPTLTAVDVVDQWRAADETGAQAWSRRLAEVAETIVARPPTELD